MPQQVLESERVIAEFDGWTLARQPLELWREGMRLRLQELPLQILELVVSRPQALVTREELTAHLWPTGVVDFDALARDPARPSHLKREVDNDGLHPSMAGYQAMADAFPVEWLERRCDQKR